MPTPATWIADDGARGRVAYVADRDRGVVDLVDLAPGMAIQRPRRPPLPASIVFSVDGARAYISAYTDDDAVNVVQMVDATRDVVAVVPVDPPALHPRRRAGRARCARRATTTRRTTARHRDQTIPVASRAANPRCVAFSPTATTSPTTESEHRHA